MRLPAMTLLFITLAAGAARAQTLPSPLARTDFAASIGSFSADRADEGSYDQWSHSWFRGLSGGLYWTDHLKTELDVAWAGTAETYGVERADLPGFAPYTQFSVRHYYRNLTVSAAQLYQFGRNARMHPFVAAGVEVDRELHESDRPEQTFRSYSGNQPTQSITIPAWHRTETTVHARPFAAAGFNQGVLHAARVLPYGSQAEHPRRRRASDLESGHRRGFLDERRTEVLRYRCVFAAAGTCLR